MNFYPITIKKMTDKEIKEYSIKRLERLCLESIKNDTFYQKKGYYFAPDLDEEELTNREKKWNVVMDDNK